VGGIKMDNYHLQFSQNAMVLSHQVGLSVPVNNANTPYNIGSAISIPRNGIIKIAIASHVSSSEGLIHLNITRNGNTFTVGNISNSISLFGNSGANVIKSNNPNAGNINLNTPNPFVLEIPVLAGDLLQFQTGNNTANTTTYIDDLLVILE